LRKRALRNEDGEGAFHGAFTALMAESAKEIFTSVIHKVAWGRLWWRSLKRYALQHNTIKSKDGMKGRRK
jgi:hypothetical protein